MEDFSKKKKLFIGILFDLIGMVSYVLPVVDVIWAPLSAYLMLRLYRGNVGKIGGLISFIEEAVPGLDFFPSFTLTWCYVYLIKRETST
jgi:hypothetical protein